MWLLDKAMSFIKDILPMNLMPNKIFNTFMDFQLPQRVKKRQEKKRTIINLINMGFGRISSRYSANCSHNTWLIGLEVNYIDL
jgi:hypothetical protein